MISTTKQITKPHWIQIASYYVIAGILALMMLGAAFMKLSKDQTLVENFAKWNLTEYMQWIAIAEILIGLGLFIRKISGISTLMLIGMMAGAVYTHVAHDEPFFAPLAIAIVASINQWFIKPKKANK